MKSKELRTLSIKSFHVNNVEFGEKNSISNSKLVIGNNFHEEVELVEEFTIDIIKPGDYDREINTIMDIVPISAKVLGKMGEGITHTITGAYLMLTGRDADGRQLGEFGSSDGNLKEKLFLNRAGTPSNTDYIIHLDVIVKGGLPYTRELPNAAFKLSDMFLQGFRDILKKIDGRTADEVHIYKDVVRTGKPKVVIIKQIAGQGAMYDNMLFAKEPSGFDGGHSIIDIGNVPIVLTPNEYRDGALRSMT